MVRQVTLVNFTTLHVAIRHDENYIEDHDIYIYTRDLSFGKVFSHVFPKCVVIVTSITNNYLYFVPLRWKTSSWGMIKARTRTSPSCEHLERAHKYA